MNKTPQPLITGAVTYESFSLQSLSHSSSRFHKGGHNYSRSLKRAVARRALTVSHSILQLYIILHVFSLGP